MHLLTPKCSKDSALTPRAADEPWGFLSLAGFLEFSLRSVLSESLRPIGQHQHHPPGHLPAKQIPRSLPDRLTRNLRRGPAVCVRGILRCTQV